MGRLRIERVTSGPVGFRHISILNYPADRIIPSPGLRLEDMGNSENNSYVPPVGPRQSIMNILGVVRAEAPLISIGCVASVRRLPREMYLLIVLLGVCDSDVYFKTYFKTSVQTSTKGVNTASRTLDNVPLPLQVGEHRFRVIVAARNRRILHFDQFHQGA